MRPADCLSPPFRIEPDEEDTMPDQPADPIHYDMKIPPEPKQKTEQSDSAKKQGDKINTESEPGDKNAERENHQDQGR